MEDEFTQRILVRFVFCSSLLLYHRHFKEDRFMPGCYPPLPTDIVNSPEIMKKIQELVELASVQVIYQFNEFL